MEVSGQLHAPAATLQKKSLYTSNVNFHTKTRRQQQFNNEAAAQVNEFNDISLTLPHFIN
jgi:hypothetical protein